MRSARVWSRFLAATAIAAAFGMVACEDDDKAVAPLEDTIPPAVDITNISHTKESLTVSVRAEDYISVKYVVTEICCDDLGAAVADTTYFVGRTTTATVTTTFAFFEAITQNTFVQIRGIGVDSQDNRAEDVVDYLITVM